MPSEEKKPQTIDYRDTHITHDFVYQLKIQQVEVKFVASELTGIVIQCIKENYLMF